MGISLSCWGQPTGQLLSGIRELVKHGHYHVISPGAGALRVSGRRGPVIEGRAGYPEQTAATCAGEARGHRAGRQG